MQVNSVGAILLMAKKRAIRRALAARAYRDNFIRIIDRDVAGFLCLVASRQGLFAVSQSTAKLVAYGLFFGLRRYGNVLYLFETCDPERGPSRMGRIVRIRLENGRLCDEKVIAAGLDNQCHQLAMVGSYICVVDTANQMLERIAEDGSLRSVISLFGDSCSDRRYHHVNSIARHAGQTLVMLHNGTDGNSRPSELAWLDDHWSLIRRETLPFSGCHDIVVDEAGMLWHCGSMEGVLFNSAGQSWKVSDQLTRGLAFAPGLIVVGTSQFALREGRTDVGGSVLLLDRSMERIAEVELGGAPTEIALL